MPIKRILIGLDGSAAAAHASEVGLELAEAIGGEVALVYAVDPGSGFQPESGIPASDLIAAALQEAREMLAAFRSRARLQEVPFEFVEIGNPVDVILKVAAEWRADMIVVASHGRGGMRRLVLGSVAEGVMRRSHCPVLVIRAGV